MNVYIWQRWTVGMVTTRGVVAQTLTSDMGHSRRFDRVQLTSGLIQQADIFAGASACLKSAKAGSARRQ
jgi:hypothetical protein